MFFSKHRLVTAALSAALVTAIFAGCGSGDQQKQAQAPKQQVKVMKVVQRDTPIAGEYAGNLVGTDEVKIQSKVSGSVVEKLVEGGQFVEQGQLLFVIDSRQYESSLLQAQASLAETEVNLQNARIDLERDQMLLKESAIAEQTVTTQAAAVRAYEAAAGAKEAAIRLAMQNLSDTRIYAPMSGQLGVDDVAVGTFVNAGTTTLVTVGSTDPIFVQFSISENEYLKFMTVQSDQAAHYPMKVTITLANGKEYPYEGQIVETDRSLGNNTGSLIMKAVFPNPGGLLMPGMFARVKLSGEVIHNAILVPQRAVQQLLGKSFVMVVGADGKSEARTVEIDRQVGSYYIIKKGVTAEDNVIVEGLTDLREGVDLAITNVTPGEMGFTMTEVTSSFNEKTITGATTDNANAPGNINQPAK